MNRVVLLSILLAAASGCAALGVTHTADDALPILRPGSAKLVSYRELKRARGWSDRDQFLLVQPPVRPDSQASVLAELEERQSDVRESPGIILATSSWSKPYESSDSLSVDGKSLAPLAETITSRRARYRYHYDGPRVRGSAATDSSTERVDRDFGEPIFAFNEVTLLVRSLRYRTGAAFVVPLFSEGDRTIEHDTLRVAGSETSAEGRELWIVDFADPVITTRYRVDAQTRSIVNAETRQRKSGQTFRLVRKASDEGSRP